MSEYQVGVSWNVPPDVVNFLETVPLFQMLEFVAFPEERRTPEEWLEEQEELLAAELSSLTQRALTVIPSGEMLIFDLAESNEDYPLRGCEMGFPEDATDIGLTIAEYLELAKDLAPLEAQMLEGAYPFDAIVLAFERRGLQSHEYWAEYLETLAETRQETEERLSELS